MTGALQCNIIYTSTSSRLEKKRSNLRRAPSTRSDGPTHIFQRSSQDTSRNTSYIDSSGSSDDHTSHRSASRTSLGRSDSRPPSRPASRAARKRAGSASTIGDKDKEKPRRKSVTGWASSAVGSVTSIGRKNKDKFSALRDDENAQDGAEDTSAEGDTSLKIESSTSVSPKKSKDKVKESFTSPSQKPSARILNPLSLREKKIARARYSFSGATDELSFQVGDEIMVVSEVLDGWWMGELNGKRGLFPTTHVEVLPPGSQPATDFRASDLGSYGGSTHWIVVDGSKFDSHLDDDQDLEPKPLHSDRSPSFHGLHPDTMSITSSGTEDDDNKHLMPIRYGSEDYAVDEHYFRSPSSTVPSGFIERNILPSLSSSPRPIRLPDDPAPGKKAPPPPPPRRLTNTLTATPPIPERPYRPYRHTPSQSVNSLKAPSSFATTTSSSSGSGGGYDRSPFESTTEL